MSFHSTSPFSLSPDSAKASTLGAIWTSRHRRPQTRLEYVRQQMDRPEFVPQNVRRRRAALSVALVVLSTVCFYFAVHPCVVVQAAEPVVAWIGGR